MKKLFVVFFVFFLVLGLSSTATALEGTVEVEIDQSGSSNELTEAEEGDNVDILVTVTGDDEIYEPDVIITLDPETGLEFDLENAYMSMDGVNWVKYGSDDNIFINEYSTLHLPNFVNEYGTGKCHWDLNSLSYYKDENDRVFTGTAWLKIPAKVTYVGPMLIEAALYDNERQEPGSELDGVLIDYDSTQLTGIPAEESNPTDDENTEENNNDENTEAILDAATNTVPMQNTGTPAIPAVLGLLAIIGGALYTRLK